MAEQDNVKADPTPKSEDQAPQAVSALIKSEPPVPQGPRTFIWGVGRRKSAVARVRVTLGTGKIQINERESPTPD